MSESEEVKMYITSYALTKGIYECTGKAESGYFRPTNLYSTFCVIGKNCFPTLDEAIVEARAMAQRQLKSLETKKQKLNKLLDGDKFKVKSI